MGEFDAETQRTRRKAHDRTVRARWRFDQGSSRGRWRVVDGSNGIRYWGKVFVLCGSPGSFRVFYVLGRRTAVFERVARPIVCMSGSELDSYVIGSTG